ncbi:ArsR/SmtB family transcription factor [Capilliphycus salinus ALCB114379]|uniref:ArsR/SmtB family transcription factor n=1 Tax=Capilliphycus salinus TaxID=2768948 RepID=UPI0039A4A6D2
MSTDSALYDAVTHQIKNREAPICDRHHTVDPENLQTVRNQTLSVEKAQRMAEFFSLLGDANRLRLLSVLAKREQCVCDLAAILEMSESAVSHQLRSLRALRLVSYRKQGRKVYYRLLDRHVLDLYQAVAEHLDETDDSD